MRPQQRGKNGEWDTAAAASKPQRDNNSRNKGTNKCARVSRYCHRARHNTAGVGPRTQMPVSGTSALKKTAYEPTSRNRTEAAMSA